MDNRHNCIVLSFRGTSVAEAKNPD